ncbi:MAG: ABC transporter ATP-binding protein [Thermoprotei archaeon]
MGITKFFGGGKRGVVTALSDVNIHVAHGRPVALVGPNGAGKTTLIRILSTLILPSSGEAYVDGHSVTEEASEVKKSIGLVTVSDRLFYYRLTAIENLVFYATLYDLSLVEARRRAREVLSAVGLTEWAETRTMHYSTGMLRRLALARALLHDPPVIMLDEPTLGIDVVSSRNLRMLVRELAREKTVLFTSHYMRDVEEIADYVYLIKNGRIVAEGTPQDLKKTIGKVVEVEVVEEGLPEGFRRYTVSSKNGHLVLRVPQSSADELKSIVLDERPSEPTLEDVYVFMVGESSMDVRPYQFRRGGMREQHLS